mgnify:CR=1 FL=1
MAETDLSPPLEICSSTFVAESSKLVETTANVNNVESSNYQSETHTSPVTEQSNVREQDVPDEYLSLDWAAETEAADLLADNQSSEPETSSQLSSYKVPESRSVSDKRHSPSHNNQSSSPPSIALYVPPRRSSPPLQSTLKRLNSFEDKSLPQPNAQQDYSKYENRITPSSKPSPPRKYSPLVAGTVQLKTPLLQEDLLLHLKVGLLMWLSSMISLLTLRLRTWWLCISLAKRPPL